jgi:hypothetical protein
MTTRTRWLLVLLVALVFSSSHAAAAPDAIPQSNRAFLRQEVAACVAVVRDRAKREHYGVTSFDAYVAGTKVRYHGTNEERFQFEKCMVERGLFD